MNKKELGHLFYSSESVVFHCEEPESWSSEKSCYEILEGIAEWAKKKIGFDGFDVRYGYNFDFEHGQEVDGMDDKSVAEIHVEYGIRMRRPQQEIERRAKFCWAILNTILKKYPELLAHIELDGKWISKQELESLD